MSHAERKGDVTLEAGRATITFRRLLRHSRERVWEAITVPSELSTWMLRSAVIDGRVGGRIEYVSSPDPIVWYGTILVWDPPRVYEHELNTDPDPRWWEHLREERTTARWELEAVGTSTRLTVTFRGFTPGTAIGFAPGTHAFVDRLEALLDGDALPDWHARFEEVAAFYGWTER